MPEALRGKGWRNGLDGQSTPIPKQLLVGSWNKRRGDGITQGGASQTSYRFRGNFPAGSFELSAVHRKQGSPKVEAGVSLWICSLEKITRQGCVNCNRNSSAHMSWELQTRGQADLPCHLHPLQLVSPPGHGTNILNGWVPHDSSPGPQSTTIVQITNRSGRSNSKPSGVSASLFTEAGLD